jgi:apolipoprotein N-acyltransferase
LLIGKDSPAASIALMATPVGYLCWFTFGRVGLPWLGRTIVAVLSLPTLVLAPLGIAFVMADSDGGIGQ